MPLVHPEVMSEAPHAEYGDRMRTSRELAVRAATAMPCGGACAVTYRPPYPSFTEPTPRDRPTTVDGERLLAYDYTREHTHPRPVAAVEEWRADRRSRRIAIPVRAVAGD